jgi:hypothetical protein
MVPVRSFHQRGPLVARKVQQAPSTRVQFGAGLFPQRQRSTGLEPVALRAFYSNCAA